MGSQLGKDENNKDSSSPAFSGQTSLSSGYTSGQASHASTRQDNTFTVDRQWKVEQELAERLKRRNGPSRLVPLAKWVATIVLGAAILFLLVATKVSFLSLISFLDYQRPRQNVSDATIEDWARYNGQMLLVYLVLLIPYGLQLLRAMKNGLCARHKPWPSRRGVISCLLVGTLEPFGLTLLALKVVPGFGAGVGLLVSGCSITLSTMVVSVLTYRGRGEGWPASCLIMSLASVLLMLGGLVGTLYLAINNNSSLAGLVHIGACLVSLNIAWLPWLQHSMTESGEEVGDQFSQAYWGTTASSAESGDSRESSSLSSPSRGSAYGVEEAGELTHLLAPPSSSDYVRKGEGQKTTRYTKATWKAAMILNFVKLVSTSLFAFLLFYVDTFGTAFSLEDSFSQPMHQAFLDGWRFSKSIQDSQTFWAFGWNLISGLVCYILVYIVLHTNIHKGGLALPLLLSFPASLLVVTYTDFCETVSSSVPVCNDGVAPLIYLIPTAAALVLGQLFSFGKQFFLKAPVNLLEETEIFWTPGYNGEVMDSWILLNWRQSLRVGRLGRQATAKPPKMRVYICTPMYREDENEMRQLLESLALINLAQVDEETFFESHIMFDGGVQGKKISAFALVLLSILDDTLGIKPSMCTKTVTPYGLKLSWALPTAPRKSRMNFNIHLKDNMLVKNKKRWSQIMYMSYVLDFLSQAVNPEEETYILTTDADVKFTPSSVAALLDLMARDSSVGAVCARTHPMGEGPLVWYQIFEYAVGHWFQKTAEHVMGSVLCSPGCFSVYRCKALRDTLPKYCKKVESAFDFLTKDMGEDRWLCTLMVQSGWKIEYCAASENSTNCPAQFEEFYKQRRRWMASTLANLILIIREWSYIDLFNERVSIIFLFYQVLLLFSTMIGPSTVILIVAGGLKYAWGFNPVAGILLQVSTCVMYTLVCLYLSQNVQFKTAKLLTFLYAAVMCAVAVGTAHHIVSDLSHPSGLNTSTPPGKNGTVTTTTTTTERPPSDISVNFAVSITTVYFGFLVSIYFIAGLLHPREFYCLFHGLWYLLCLPSGYLILTIYSICNLTDSSWGTREGVTEFPVIKSRSWHELYKELFYYVFFCCDPKEKEKRGKTAEEQAPAASHPRSGSVLSVDKDVAENPESKVEDGSVEARGNTPINCEESDLLAASGEFGGLCDPFDGEEEEPIAVEEWLPLGLRMKYADTLIQHGFDNTLFIKALSEKEMTRMGIVKRGHVQYILAQIALLPAFEIESQVPTNVKEWLKDIGLSMYQNNFRRNQIRTPKEMEILKRFSSRDIARELGITKEGHIKRLLYAIRMLKEPSESQLRAIETRQHIDDSPVHNLMEISRDEFQFWTALKEKCLKPDLKAFGLEAEVKEKLGDLRNSWLMILAVANTLWLILISTLATKADLAVVGANPIGLLFLAIFGFLFLLQFLAMLVHRSYTLSHYLAQASYKYSKPLDTRLLGDGTSRLDFEDAADFRAITQIKQDERRAFRAALQSRRRDRDNRSLQGERSEERDSTTDRWINSNSMRAAPSTERECQNDRMVHPGDFEKMPVVVEVNEVSEAAPGCQDAT